MLGWCLKKFAPYKELAEGENVDDIASDALSRIEDILDNDEFKKEFLDFLSDNKEFRDNLVAEITDPYDLERLLFFGLEQDRYEGIMKAYLAVLQKPEVDTKEKMWSVKRAFEELLKYHSGPNTYKNYTLDEIDLDEELWEEDKGFYVYVKYAYDPVVRKMTEPRIQNQFKAWDALVEKYYYDYDRVAELRKEKEKQEGDDEALSKEESAKLIAPIVSGVSDTINDLIFKGEYVAGYKAVDKTFELCFNASQTTYDVLCEKLLSKYGEVVSIGKGLFKGVIPSANIEEIYMLVTVTRSIENYLAYSSDKDNSNEVGAIRAKINAPIVNYIIKYNRFAKLLYLEVQASKIGVDYYQNSILKHSYRIWRNNEINETDKAKAMFSEMLSSGEIKSKFVSKQRMFYLIKDRFPDAVYKYTPDWSEQPSDVYIPSINVAVAYYGAQHYQTANFDGKKTDLAAQQKKDEELQNSYKRAGVTFIVWNCREPLNYETLVKKLGSYLKESKD